MTLNGKQPPRNKRSVYLHDSRRQIRLAIEIDIGGNNGKASLRLCRDLRYTIGSHHQGKMSSTGVIIGRLSIPRCRMQRTTCQRRTSHQQKSTRSVPRRATRLHPSRVDPQSMRGFNLAPAVTHGHTPTLRHTDPAHQDPLRRTPHARLRAKVGFKHRPPSRAHPSHLSDAVRAHFSPCVCRRKSSRSFFHSRNEIPRVGSRHLGFYSERNVSSTEGYRSLLSRSWSSRSRQGRAIRVPC